MAIDTRDKRASIIGLVAASIILPLADGAIGAADRQLLAYTYSGVSPVIEDLVVSKAESYVVLAGDDLIVSKVQGYIVLGPNTITGTLIDTGDDISGILVSFIPDCASLELINAANINVSEVIDGSTVAVSEEIIDTIEVLEYINASNVASTSTIDDSTVAVTAEMEECQPEP